MPNVDGSKWGRVLSLPTVPWHQRRSGDLILWRHHNGLLIPAHVGILLNADENFIMHSGYTGPPSEDWQRYSIDGGTGCAWQHILAESVSHHRG